MASQTLTRFCAILILLCPLFAPAQSAYSEGYVPTPDGVRLYFRVYGKGSDTLVFLHGGPGGNLETPIEGYLPLAARHVIIAYDQRGGGRSVPADSSGISLASHVEDLETVRRSFRLQKFSLYGLSWGATIALHYAHRYPDHLYRMILDGPMPPAREPFDRERSKSFETALETLCRKRAEAAGATDIEAAIAECKKTRNIHWRVQYYDTANFQLDAGRAKRETSGVPGVTQAARIKTMQSLGNWDFRPVMKEVKTATLIVTGSHAFPPLAHFQTWAATLPDARLLIVPQSGHETSQFENPGYFFPEIEKFLSGKWPTETDQ